MKNAMIKNILETVRLVSIIFIMAVCVIGLIFAIGYAFSHDVLYGVFVLLMILCGIIFFVSSYLLE